MNPLCLIAAITLGTCVLHASTDIRQQLDSLFESRYADGPHSPGGAVIIARGDSVLYERYSGMADIEKNIPVTDSTLFCIASVSKQFTVIGLLQQVQQGKADINGRCADYLPYTHPLWKKVTLADLAGHTSGIPDARDRSRRDGCLYATDASSIRYFKDVDALKFEPGTAYDYLNPSFLLIAKVIEDKSGLEFTQYQHKHVLEPAGMKHARYYDPTDMPATEAHGYMPAKDGSWAESDYGEETFYATRPDGCLYATARDMLAWERALASGKLVAPELLDMAYTPRISVSDSEWCDYQRRPNTHYGLGWFIDTTPGEPVKVYHTGDNGGFQAYMAKYPADGTVIIVLENRHDQPRWEMARAIDAILSGQHAARTSAE